MGFESKIRQLCAKTDRFAMRALSKETRDIANLASAILREEKWANVPIRTSNRIGALIQSAQDAADEADACDYLFEKVLEASNGVVCDVRMPANLRDLQDEIYDLFDRGDAPRRGFVYVAWRSKPEEYWYVGKASAVGRLNLAAHGKLAHASAYATTLSLLFPTQSREEILRGVEASLLRVITACTGSLPEHNVKRESVPAGQASRDLGALADFFRNLGDDISPFREAR